MAYPDLFAMQPEEERSILDPSLPQWAQMVEQGDARAVGIVDQEAAFALSEQDIIEQVNAAQMESEHARAEFHDRWWQWESLYNLDRTDADKQDWQADLIIPEVRHKILTLKSLMQSALVDPERFFAILTEGKLFPEEQIRFIESWMYLAVREAKMRPALLRVMGEAFLYGTGWMKVSIASEMRMRPGIEQVPIYPDPQQAMAAMMAGFQTMRPAVSVVPEIHSAILCEMRHVRQMFPDPLARFGDRKSRYTIERFEADREETEEMVRLGIYDSAEDLGEGMHDMLGRREDQRFRESSVRNRTRDVIQEYVGNLYTREGTLACRNWIVTVANERKVLRIGPNPIWSGKSRYTCCTPIPRDDSPWGESFIEADAVVEVELKALLDLMTDSTKYEVLGAFQIDELASNEPEAITGIEPGRVYHGDGEFIRRIALPSATNNAWPLVTKLEGIGDKSTMVNEFAAGMPSSRGRPTAEEVRTKSSTSTGHIHNVARCIEEDFVEPTLDLIYEYLLQFGGDVSPGLDEIAGGFGGAEALRDPVMRFALLDVPFRFQVRGISMLADRESIWQRLMQLSQMGQQLGKPPEDQGVKLWYTMISSMGFSPEQVGYSANPSQYQAFLQAQMMQQQQAQGGQPAQVGGASGPVQGNGTSAPPGQVPSGTGAPPSSTEMPVPPGAMDQLRQEMAPAV